MPLLTALTGLKDKAQISMAEVGEPTRYGYAERLMRTIKEEEVDLSEYRDYHDVYQHIGPFIEDVSMHKRVHSALGYLTPAEFEQQWLALPVKGLVWWRGETAALSQYGLQSQITNSVRSAGVASRTRT
jgi:hypothetical protein